MPSEPRRRPLSVTVRLVCALLGTGVVAYAMIYFLPGAPIPFSDQAETFRREMPWLYLHIGGGSVALLLLPLQLWHGARRRLPRLHRYAGRLSAAGVAAGAIGGLGIAPHAQGGISNAIGFSCLALAWATTTALAILAARRGDLTSHRAWMLRSAALTFAGISLRLWIFALEPVMGFETAYQLMGWLAWVPNLLAIEWWLRRGALARPAGAPATA